MYITITIKRIHLKKWAVASAKEFVHSNLLKWLFNCTEMMNFNVKISTKRLKWKRFIQSLLNCDWCKEKWKVTTLFCFLLSFSWTRNGTHFDAEEDPNVTVRLHSGTLVVDISREKAEHYEGVYQCTARNKHGTAVSNNIVVRQSSKWIGV